MIFALEIDIRIVNKIGNTALKTVYKMTSTNDDNELCAATDDEIKNDKNSNDSDDKNDKPSCLLQDSEQSSLRKGKDSRKSQEKRRKVMYEDDDYEDKLEIKEERHSDEATSVISDINPPSLATRLRVRKKERRHGPKSACDSVQSKAQSEPILITLSDSKSESDDNEDDDYSPQDNKSSRLKRSVLRNLGQGVSDHDSDSSLSASSDGSETKKKKSHKKKVMKGKKKMGVYALKRRRQERIMKLKKRRLYEKDYDYTTSHSAYLRKRIQKAKNSPIKRRPTRKCSIASKETNENPAIKEESPEREPVPAPRRRLGRPPKKSFPPKEDSTHCEIKNEIDRIRNSPKVELTDIRLQLETKLKAFTNAEVEKEEENENKDDSSVHSPDEENSLERNEQLDRIKSDLEKIRSNNPENLTEEQQEDEESGEKQSKPKSKSHKKSKQKPGSGKRPRGRPKLSEASTNIVPEEKTVDVSSFYIKPNEIYLQSHFCFDISPKLSKCRECKIAVSRNRRDLYNSYCRFMEYRKICCDKKDQILSAGFSSPRDAKPEDISIWLPEPDNQPKDLDFETAKSLLEHIGDQFCDLVSQEKEAYKLHLGIPQGMTWKKIVHGVREMCDVCSTTIFNIHWVCPICGFAVCIDCYKNRKQGITFEEEEEDRSKERDQYRWLFCNSRLEHEQDSLVMAEMVIESALDKMWTLMHKARKKLGIPAYCKCNPPSDVLPDKLISSGINKQLMSQVSKNFYSEENFHSATEKINSKVDISYEDLDVEVTVPGLKWIENLTKLESISAQPDDDNINNYEDLRLLLKANLTTDASDSETEYDGSSYSLEDIISCTTKQSNQTAVKHFNERYPQPSSGRDPLPIRIYTKIESELLFPNVPHSWFCNGRLLFLHQADHVNNLALFKELWKRGQPIMVKGVDKKLDMSLWTPKGFCRDFGEIKNDLVNCKTGAILKNLPMKKFWNGFESLNRRLVDDDDEPMLLKLKDWPPGEDFSEKLPTRFQDLMKGLPLPEYTHRDGVFNLAGRLPSSFVRPDLGPKMYNAYGSALFPTKGTTNLHLDISDAVNVMVYVGIPSDGNAQSHIVEALKAIDEGGCDSLMRDRVRTGNTKPGALWHIYNARDADKIREMLTEVAKERGEKLEANNDPIHDQCWYIDAELRQRLYRDYGVEGFAIAQCLGDAVFIPAGAPHQVRNLHSCVKVAEDFVSPENIAHCFKLTQEFRQLSDTHTNHEDKLQIKNIIYHVVRDSLSLLLHEDKSLEFA